MIKEENVVWHAEPHTTSLAQSNFFMDNTIGIVDEKYPNKGEGGDD